MRSFWNVTWGAAYGVLSRRPTPWFPEESKGLPSQCTVKGNEVWAECSVATAGAWAVVEPCLLPQHTGSTRSMVMGPSAFNNNRTNLAGRTDEVAAGAPKARGPGDWDLYTALPKALQPQV